MAIKKPKKVRSSGLRVALVQARPVFLDLKKSLDKAVRLVRKSAKDGARLVAFSETWLPGYPAWYDYCADAALWDHPPMKSAFARLTENSVSVPGPETKILSGLARELGLVLVMGVHERVRSGTLFNTLLTFDTDGRLLGHHRKLMPTYTERLLWGMGDASGLRVMETAVARVGGLICWEHWMPLSRQALHDGGEQVHIAAWPDVHEMHQVASRHYAFEGRCFVLAVGQLLHTEDVPDGLRLSGMARKRKGGLFKNGGSAVIAPDGRYLAGPLFDRESILFCDLDLSEITEGKLTLDTAGHYSRPDVFRFSVLRKKRKRDG